MKTREDVLLGVAALFIAFLLWFSTQPLFEPGKELEFAVGLRYEGLDDEAFVAITPAEPVMVVASGSALDLDRLDTETIEAVVDLSSVDPGVRRLPVDIVGINVPGVTVSPKRTLVEIEIDEVARKSLPISVNPTGATPTGLSYSGSQTEPQEVQVYGPAQNMGKVETLQVTLNLGAVTPGSTVVLPVEVLDAEGRAVPAMATLPTTVTVIPLTQSAPAVRTVPINLNWEGTLPRGYRVDEVELTPNQISLTGSSAEISMIGGVDTEAIQLEGRTDDFSQTLQLLIPDGLVSTTESVEIRVKIVRSGSG